MNGLLWIGKCNPCRSIVRAFDIRRFSVQSINNHGTILGTFGALACDGGKAGNSSPGELPRRSWREEIVLVTVLVVDDDEAISELVGDALQQQGHTIITAATIQDAEEAKQRLNSTPIGLVICDIHLTADPQEHEGYALYQRWTASDPDLPFLLMSGDRQALNLPAIQSGGVRFLPKPFLIEDLLAAVQALIRG
jgi:two-component system cell cycle sensor histidine kinase/response regulator CckA